MLYSIHFPKKIKYKIPPHSAVAATFYNFPDLCHTETKEVCPMKRIATLLVLVLFLSGCANRNQITHRVVTGVEVEYTRNGETIHRTYSTPRSIQSILTYLRILRPFGPVIPEDGADSSCTITLQYSHGPDSVFLQYGDRYLQRDNGDWKRINTSYATLLYPLLLLLPSDSAKNR